MTESLNRNDFYTVEEILKTTANGWTEKVTDRSGQTLIRKYIGNAAIEFNEYEILNNLNHPAFPTVIEQYEFEGFRVIVMEYIHGKTLCEAVELLGKLDPGTAIDLTMQICSAIDYLHTSYRTPIIHRDIKPENVMLREGVIKIIDFGIARVYKPENHRDTVYMGTIGYAPPEQFGFGQTDIRTDIYSIGMTLQFLLTGVHPGRDSQKVNDNLQPDIRQVINKCTGFAPESRYISVKALMENLQEVKNTLVNRIQAQTQPASKACNTKRKQSVNVALWLVHFLIFATSIEIFKQAFNTNSGFGSRDDFILRVKQISMIFVIFLPPYLVGFNVLECSDHISRIAFLKNKKRLQVVLVIILAFLLEAFITGILNQFHTPAFIRSL